MQGAHIDVGADGGGMKRFEPRRKAITSEGVGQVIAHLDALLASGRLSAGQRLIEKEIVEELGVGRAQVREALRILAGDGVVDLAPNYGARVRAIGKRRLLEMLGVMNALLALALRDYVAQRNLRASLRRLEKAVAPGTVQPETASALDLLAVLEAFNAEIVAGAQNGYLSEIIERIHFNHYNQLLATMLPHAVLVRFIDQYRAVATALAGQDVATARALLDEGYGWMIETLEAAPLASRRPAGAA